MNAHKNAQLTPHSRSVLVCACWRTSRCRKMGRTLPEKPLPGRGVDRPEFKKPPQPPTRCRHLHVPGPVAVSRPLNEPGAGEARGSEPDFALEQNLAFGPMPHLME